MTVTGKHYHFSTGKESKNRGGYYLCQNKTMNAAEGCLIYPAYRMPDGGWRIVDMVRYEPTHLDVEGGGWLITDTREDEEDKEEDKEDKEDDRLDKYIGNHRLFF